MARKLPVDASSTARPTSSADSASATSATSAQPLGVAGQARRQHLDDLAPDEAPPAALLRASSTCSQIATRWPSSTSFFT